MKTRLKLLLVGIETSLRPLILAAAQQAFPQAETVEASTLAEAAPGPAGDAPALLVLTEPGEALLAEATQAVDARGAPRWAVVVLGHGSSEVAEIMPPEGWQPATLARMFRAVVMQHELLRENLRLRGDLKAVARRVNHELRTPVGCIHTSSDLLDEMSVGQDAMLGNIAEIFRQSSREISQIVDRVSFLLRASSDPVMPVTTDMGGVVVQVFRQLQDEIRTAGAVVRQPDTWPQVMGVPPWIQVIWWNLLRNALQHGGPASQVRLTWVREVGAYRFAVVDQGAGVDPAQEAGLFVPFDQLGAQRTAGLGLSIVQRLTALQGGECRYRREPGTGTSFEFTLPAVHEPAGA
ncbi:MAG: HAMP domain-containing histidine kinase [Verrucomicrobia bacterium]|nr:HAMP domain-containing histidine kinase [Verrucomicrobiota bacterium]